MNHSEIEFRRLGLSDLESCFANRLRALENAPSAFLTSLAEEKAAGSEHFKETLSGQDSENLIFGALQNSKVIATLGIYREKRLKIRHKAGIWGVFVDPEYRRQGIAAKLLDLAIGFARAEMNVLTISLSVESKASSARKLYESRGFKVWGTEALAMGENGAYFDEDHMILIL